ncbi:hypothetical protein A1O3_05904 [Capronia epimyces CBS 606.96]|uniref:Zn(2)-C6 fungal-type domain-containing protein n=1 Tax=Capronia epimyces CBS 606.96 TaxID=1182542 RepID=W9YSG5_9EURO|nr:uncharacterized protein A1O3_05904 [Capronia epimyces CBS 606.96]EXJ85229.1 hypothetical protein A1O3_05904 [Capronia epimyces CBS 606.96]
MSSMGSPVSNTNTDVDVPQSIPYRASESEARFPPQSQHHHSTSLSADSTRTKKWAPKTFNGCLTCKKRRIKCDEEKPKCLRCTRSNINCLGYAPPRIRLFEPTSSSSARPAVSTNPPSNRLQLQSYLTSHPHPQGLALTSTFGTEEECQSFQFFLEKTSDLISVYSNPYLWTVILPQATWHEPAIKHSVIALACLHLSLTTVESSSVRSNNKFVYHYNNAIRALLEGKLPVDIVLAACVIFWALENFNGSSQAAFDHMKAAITILGEWKAKLGPDKPADDLISTYLEPSIRDCIKFVSKNRLEELQGQMSTLSLSAQDRRIMNIELPTFQTLNAASDYLGQCIQAILTLQHMPLSPELTETIQEIDARLYKWMSLFQNLAATGPVFQRRMLVVHNVAAYILLDQVKAQTSYSYSRESSQQEQCRCKFIVHEVEEMLKNDLVAMGESFRELPSALGLIPPIFLAATSSTKAEVRRKAMMALRLAKVVEGSWNSETAASIAEALVEIGERFPLPHSSQVGLRHVKLAVDKHTRVLSIQMGSGSKSGLWPGPGPESESESKSKPEQGRSREDGFVFAKEITLHGLDWLDLVSIYTPASFKFQVSAGGFPQRLEI